MEWGNLSGLWKSSQKGFNIHLNIMSIDDGMFKAKVQEVSDSMVRMGVWYVLDPSTYPERKKESTRHTLYAIFPRQPGVRLRITECETPTITKGCMVRGDVWRVPV